MVVVVIVGIVDTRDARGVLVDVGGSSPSGVVKEKSEEGEELIEDENEGNVAPPLVAAVDRVVTPAGANAALILLSSSFFPLPVVDEDEDEVIHACSTYTCNTNEMIECTSDTLDCVVGVSMGNAYISMILWRRRASPGSHPLYTKL